MKKTLYVILFVIFLSSCSNSNSKRQTVSTDGSSSIEKVIGFLGEYYREENPDVRVSFNPTGSGAGIQSVAEGRCDIGLSSRDLKDKEISKGLKATVLAIDGIALAVNKNNPVKELTLDEIASIYTGEINNWSALGGIDGTIVSIGREASSGTRDAFEMITDTKDKCRYHRELTSTGDVLHSVAANKNAIGYISLASLNADVSAVAVDGVIPDKENIQNGTYKLKRDYIMVTKADKALSDTAQGFFDFAVSKEADALIERAGAIPVLK